MEEHWLKQYWRPAMAWSYFIVCLFDFMLAPIGIAVYMGITNTPYAPWVPLTLQSSGLYHLSMGAIIGVTAWSRGMEKLAGIEQKDQLNG